MSDLSSKFTRDDIETLIEAMNDWEMIGNQEFHVLQMVKNAPMPPEDHEAHEFMQQLKEHFTQRERDIKASRETRQEKAVFLKAKLMLTRKELGISQLFDMASNTDADAPATPVKAASKKIPVKVAKPQEESPDLAKKLELAEYYIRDLGEKVWDFYQKFLKDREESA